MQLPKLESHYSNLVLFGAYATARLRRARHEDWAVELWARTAAVRAAGRGVEDARIEVVMARADRDATDDDMDDLAKNGRRDLGGRSNNAMKEAPYTQVFHQGIEHVTLAPLDAQEQRYTDLAERYTKYLPPDDALIADAQKIVDALVAWRAVKAAVAAKQNLKGQADSDYEAAVEAWATTLERVYGRLIDAHKKRGAERFFPRVRGAGGDDGGNADGGSAPPTP